MNTPKDNSRRDFLKKTAYVVPVIITMSVAPSLASAGSPNRPRNDNYAHGGKISREHARHSRHGFLHSLKDAFRKLF